MAEFTREQLIACAETALSDARTAANFHDSKPYHQMRVHLAEIALAALAAAPEAYVVGSYSLLHYQNPKLDEYIKNATPLYRLPPLEGLK